MYQPISTDVFGHKQFGPNVSTRCFLLTGNHCHFHLQNFQRKWANCIYMQSTKALAPWVTPGSDNQNISWYQDGQDSPFLQTSKTTFQRVFQNQVPMMMVVRMIINMIYFDVYAFSNIFQTRFALWFQVWCVWSGGGWMVNRFKATPLIPKNARHNPPLD